MLANEDDVALLNEILTEYGESSPTDKLVDDRGTPSPVPGEGTSISTGKEGDSTAAVDLVLAPPSDRDHVIHVNRQSVCTFDITVPMATKLPEVFAFRISSQPVAFAERLLGYGYKISVNHISNNTDVVDGDVELKEGEMTLEEEIFPPTYHSPKFSKGEEGDLGELSPFQAMIDLPTSSDNWASPVAKDAPPTTIKIVIDNTKSLFRPRRLTFQYAFFSKKIRDTAVGAAGDMRQRELEEKTKQYQQLKESGALGMKILGGLVVGGVVTGGGIGALAGGMVVVGGWKAVEKIKEGIDKAGDEADFEQEEKAREDAVREGKMKELEERLSEQTKLQQLEKGDWEEQRNMLLSSLSNLKLQLLHSESSCSELRKNLDSERLKSDQRERELIVSVVELEGHVRKLKRDKKVLVVEVRKLQSENERVKVEMEAELEQAKMNYRAAKAEVRKRSGGGDEGGEREREKGRRGKLERSSGR